MFTSKVKYSRPNLFVWLKSHHSQPTQGQLTNLQPAFNMLGSKGFYHRNDIIVGWSLSDYIVCWYLLGSKCSIPICNQHSIFWDQNAVNIKSGSWKTCRIHENKANLLYRYNCFSTLRISREKMTIIQLFLDFSLRSFCSCARSIFS